MRLLCIRKEISLGADSPAEDSALRMEYQVEQLKQGFGKINRDAEEGPGLALEWLSVPAAEEHIYHELQQRFYTDLFKI